MRNDAKRAASAATRNRTVRGAGTVPRMAIGLGVALAMSSAMAAGHAAPGGIVRFAGALVDLYDVTLDARSGVAVPGREVESGGAVATLRFDAHGRRLPGLMWRWSGPTARRSYRMPHRVCAQRGAMRATIEACRWYRAARIAWVRMAA